MSSTLLASVEQAPRDPILGLTEAFIADKNPRRVNLGVGVYYDDRGKVPLLDCVKQAELQFVESSPARSYLPIDGLPAYDRAVRDLVFGADCAAVKEGRVLTVQTLGGTGGLRVGADFLRRFAPGAELWISDPSWENHRALFETAGFRVHAYPYYDPRNHGLDFERMIGGLESLPTGSIVVLHACCHNPTGVDLEPWQWERVIEVVTSRALIPFLDIAYQGFGEGLDADGLPVRQFAAAGGPVFVSNSFSKSFSLYGERIGALSVVADSQDQAARVLSQVKRLVRTNYSNPPTHGGQIVATVLTTPALRAIWEEELEEMRDRIRLMRAEFVELTREAAPDHDFSFIMSQRGMFSYSGLNKGQVHRLRDEFAIYAVESGRICLAALNSHNIAYVCEAVAKLLR
jgi:aromatic-amino-acid transaminase